jgi:hypothetical protein
MDEQEAKDQDNAELEPVTEVPPPSAVKVSTPARRIIHRCC